MSHHPRTFVLAAAASVAVITVMSLAGGNPPATSKPSSTDPSINPKPIGWCGTTAACDPPRPSTADPAAIERLRAIGQPALDELCAEYDHLAREASPDHASRLAELRPLIDSVAAQRDASVSRLFWHTDWRRALDEAARTHKPILSLRLLGRLDEDRSCANSRFFRTILYANTTVADRLRDGFVLHWESLRPVPQLTIDFGDGRRIERTITGNSIHYVLNPKGELIDAIPGLYGPTAFLRALENAELAANRTMQDGGADDFNQRQRIMEAYHHRRIELIHAAWTGDLATLGRAVVTLPGPAPTQNGAGGNPTPVPNAAAPNAPAPNALVAMPIAPTKARLEIGALHAMQPISRFAALETTTTDDLWPQVARLHAADAVLDDRSIELMRIKVPTEVAEAAQQLTTTKRLAEAPFMTVLRTFRESLAEDTVRNEYLLHRQIHEWLAASAGATIDVAEFNERVYAQLFLTPLDDPWMGLAPSDTFAALDEGGLVARSRPRP